MGLTHFDIHLLHCLDALLSESHVTRAAARMNIGQPAMSAALARLRRLFGDPLLVRTNQGMALTPRALEVRGRVHAALELIEGALTGPGKFQPDRDAATLRVSAGETVMLALFPALARIISRQARGMQLLVDSPTASRLREDLVDGRTDLVIAYLDEPPDELRATPLYETKLKVIASSQHERIRARLSLAAYVDAYHVGYAVGGDVSTIERRIDRALEGQALQRRMALVVPSTTTIPLVVSSSQLLATLPEHVIQSCARQSELQVFDPPLPLPPVQVSMYWHDRMHHVPAHQWLRAQVRVAANALS